MSSGSAFRVVAVKEIVDNLRDRRTLAAALLYPLLGPGMILLIIYTLGASAAQVEEVLKLPVAGADRAPDLVAYLQQREVEITAPPADPERAVREGDLDVVLIIPEGFADAFSEARPARVQLVHDRSRRSAATNVRRARSLLEGYSRQIGSLRLRVRGVDPRVVSALSLEERDVSTPQSQAASLLSIAPYFIIFALFVGGMYLAIDSTAGERERGSLEPLLLNPVKRSSLVMGKMVATLLFTALAVAETLGGFALVLNYFPVEEYVGVQMSLPPLSVLAIFLISCPMMLLAVSLQLLVASSTHSFKEAQNYITLLTFVPAIPALILSMVPTRLTNQLALVPMVGQQLLINQIMRADEVEPLHVGLSAASTIVFAVAVILVVIRLYHRERFVTG